MNPSPHVAPAVPAAAPVVAPTIADRLEGAAALIEERGLCRGTFLRDGQVCIRGAINLAIRGNAWDSDDDNDHGTKSFVLAALAERGWHPSPERLVNPRWVTPAEWNNSPGSSKEVAAAVLRRAASLARAQGV